MTGMRAAALLAAGMAALSLVSCGRKPADPAAPPAFPYPTGALSNFILGPTGLLPLPPGTVPGPGTQLQAPLAPRVASLAVAPGRSGLILAALNRYGLGLVEFSPDRSAYRIINKPLREMSSQSVAALWPRSQSGTPGQAPNGGGSFLLELYRDPFIPGALPRSDTAPELLSIAGNGDVTVLDRIGKPEEELFALFPGPRGLWYAELRAEEPLGARLRYLSFASPEQAAAEAKAPGGSRGTELRKDLFEASLAPRPLSLAPSSLRRAAEAFEGPVLVRARGESGGDAYWISAGGGADDAREVNAWISADEESVIALDRAGHGSFLSSSSGRVARFSLTPPLPESGFGSVVALTPPAPAASGPGAPSASGAAPGAACILAASWEAGSFPTVSQSGLVVTTLIP